MLKYNPFIDTETTGLPCLMHCTKNTEERGVKTLSAGTKRVLHLSKLIYGSRKKSGFRLNSLKRELNDLLHENCRSTISAPFRTD